MSKHPRPWSTKGDRSSVDYSVDHEKFDVEYLVGFTNAMISRFNLTPEQRPEVERDTLRYLQAKKQAYTKKNGDFLEYMKACGAIYISTREQNKQVDQNAPELEPTEWMAALENPRVPKRAVYAYMLFRRLKLTAAEVINIIGQIKDEAELYALVSQYEVNASV